MINAPTLVGDSAGIIHLIWTGHTLGQPDDSPEVVLYARWDGSGWIGETDVQAATTGAAWTEAVVGTDSILHLIWTDEQQLYYSQAPTWSAMDPRSWSQRQLISDHLRVFTPGDIEITAVGDLHAVFAASDQGAVYLVTSTTGGQQWTAPTPIHVTQQFATSVARLAIDVDGSLHAVWELDTLPDGYPPAGVLYARSADDGQTWSEPAELAGLDYGEGEIVASNNGTLHVVYNGRAGVGGRYHRWSSDGGVTWSAPVEVIAGGTSGMTGYPGLAVDSEDVLYFVGTGASEHPHFSEWQGDIWSPLEDLSSLSTLQLGYCEDLALAMAAGNQLHTVFWDDRQRLWHTWRTVNAAYVLPEAYPTMIPVDSEFDTVVMEPTATHQDEMKEMILPPSTKDTSNPLQAVLVAFASSALLVGVCIGFRWIRRGRPA